MLGRVQVSAVHELAAFVMDGFCGADRCLRPEPVPEALALAVLSQGANGAMP